MARNHEPDPRFENGQDIRDRTLQFACRAATFCLQLQHEGAVARASAAQLAASSRSTAAMLEEARSAESRRDFISTCAIALKEARESLVRIRICLASGIGDRKEAATLVREADEIVAVLMSIVRNARRNAARSGSATNARTNS